MARLLLIGFCGPIGSGKTEAAKMLQAFHGFGRVRFADPLKDMLRCLGLGDRELDGDRKAQPSAILGGKTPRFAMQTLGTEWGRELIDPDLWINAWRHQVGRMRERWASVVADDVRFPNEVEAIRALGGVVVRVERPRVVTDAHPSEHQELSVDHTLRNDGDTDDLANRLFDLLQELSL